MENEEYIILIPALTIGGAEKVALSHATELSSRGYKTSIIVLSSNIKLSVSRNIKLMIGSESSFLKQLFFAFSTLRSIVSNSSGKINVISYMERANLINVILSNFLPIKPLLSVHTAPKAGFKLRSKKNQSLISFTYRLAAKLNLKTFTVSDGITNELRENYGQRNVKTIYNPISFDEFEYKENYPDGDKKNILFVGRLEKVKGCDLLIKAFLNLSEKDRLKANLTIVGNGSELETLKGISNNEPNIKFVGSRYDVANYYTEADAVVIPSLAEGFCLVMIEALIRGKNVIYSQCDYGPKELAKKHFFNEGLLSFSDPSKDYELALEQLTAQLSIVINNQTKAISDDVKQTILKEFSINKITNEILEFAHS
ncbi:TPA: glycosyltransferase [Vibrio parahaemolyticus]|nr:glycosyltransferase [Vibrio parahaemolyticus]